MYQQMLFLLNAKVKKKKESVEKEKTAYDKLFSSNHSKAEGFITVHKVKEKFILNFPY